jgi:hypothetical protein
MMDADTAFKGFKNEERGLVYHNTSYHYKARQNCIVERMNEQGLEDKNCACMLINVHFGVEPNFVQNDNTLKKYVMYGNKDTVL